MLIDGRWEANPEFNTSKDGRFKRPESSFRSTITTDGEFTPDANRYHLYVAHACPWANRATIMRNLKGLQGIISLSYVDPVIVDKGWAFSNDHIEFQDPIYNKSYLHEIYIKANHQYTGRVTVPVLWDKHTETIVNNESAEILRILNDAFNDSIGSSYDYYPQHARQAIDEINSFIYTTINNGVYKCGFAKTQEAYTEAYYNLFKALDKLEERLLHQRFLVGNDITEADIRLFTTLVRFDPVYVGHFKCNKQRIFDYPNLWNYLLDMYQTPGIGETIDLEKIKQHYYLSHTTINPTQIIPEGPDIDFLQAHCRCMLSNNIEQN